MHILHSEHHTTAAYTVLERVNGAELQGAGLSRNGRLWHLFRVTTAILGDRTSIRIDDFQNRLSSVRDFVTGLCQFSTGDWIGFEKKQLYDDIALVLIAILHSCFVRNIEST